MSHGRMVLRSFVTGSLCGGVFYAILKVILMCFVVIKKQFVSVGGEGRWQWCLLCACLCLESVVLLLLPHQCLEVLLLILPFFSHPFPFYAESQEVLRKAIPRYSNVDQRPPFTYASLIRQVCVWCVGVWVCVYRCGWRWV